MKRRKFIQNIAIGSTFSILPFWGIFNNKERINPSNLVSVNHYSLNELSWRNIKSVKDVTEAFPQRIRGLMNYLDFEQSELTRVRKALEKDNLTNACMELLRHYRESDQVEWWRNPSFDKSKDLLKKADEILQNIYHGFGDKGKVPRRPDGHLDGPIVAQIMTGNLQTGSIATDI